MFKNICGLIFWVIMLAVHFAISGFMLLITSVFIYCGFVTNEYVTITIMFLALCTGAIPFFTILFEEWDAIRCYFGKVTNKDLWG